MVDPGSREAPLRRSTLERTLPVVGALAIAATIVLGHARAAASASFDWMLWTDRDLVRAGRLAIERPVLGPEVSFGDGARLPGALLVELWGLVLAVAPTPEAVFRLGLAMRAAALLALGLLVGRRAGPLGGALAAATAAATLAWTRSSDALWNPAFVPLFAVAVLVGGERAVAGERPAAVAATALAGALGAQVHLTVGAEALVVLLGVGVLAPRVLVRGLPGAFAAVVIAYLPYLVVDGGAGFPNARALLAAAKSDPGSGDVVAAAGWLRLAVDDAVGLAAGGDALLLGVVGALVALAGGLRSRDRARATLLLPTAVVAATVVGLARSDNGPAALRYALVAAPALGWLVGEGWGRLARRGAVAALLVTAATASLAVAAVRAADAAVEGRAGEPTRRAAVERVLDDVRAATGWSLVDAVGRTALWAPRGEDFAREARVGVDWMLHRAGATFPGSLPSPCAIVVLGGRGLAVDDAWLATHLSASLGRPTLVRAAPSGPHDLIVLHALEGGRCPTSFAQRYLPTAAEDDVRAAWRRPPAGEAVPVDARPWRRVGRLDVSGASPIGVAVDLVPRPGGLDVTLHANQLRGRAYNTGLLEDAWVARPRVRLAREGEARELVLAPGLVGDGAVLTPLTDGGRLPAGRWSAMLVADVATGRAEPGSWSPPTTRATLALGVVDVPPEVP